MKDLFLILVLCVLATSKVTLQGQFAKKAENTFCNAICFNTIIFAASALLFIKWIAGSHIQTAAFGAVFGLLTVLFQAFYIIAMSNGNVSLTVMIVNFSMIIPIAFSLIYYNEKITAFQIIGILLVITALLLSLEKGGKKYKSFKKWLFLAVCASLINGGLAVCQKIFASGEYRGENKGFVAWAYITAFIISALVSIFLKFHIISKENSLLKITPQIAALGISAGAVLAVFQWLNTYAVSVIDSTILFPSYNGGSMVLSALSGVLLLRDKLTKKQVFSVVTGAVAVIILTL